MNIIKNILAAIALSTVAINGNAQTVDVSSAGKTLDHYWSFSTCGGRVNEGLRSSWQEQLLLSKKECGFGFIRMHGLFDDDMFVYFDKGNGKRAYNWQYIDEVYDKMLEMGVRPFVELSFFPKGIAKDNSLMQMWYQNRVSYDPSRLGKWKDLVAAFVKHEVERYGLEEVRKWYFEVWNEPNLNMYPKAGFFDGTKSDYFAMYKASAEAIKAVDSKLRVGGPATSNFIPDARYEGEIYDNSKSRFYNQEKINKQQWKGAWIEDFLAFCEKENLPVDFISCHPYPTDYALDPESGRSKDAVRYINSLSDDIAWLKKTIAKSKYPNAEIHLTEWSTSPNSRDKMHDLLPPAAFIVKSVCDNIGKVNSLMYWTFTDIFEEKGGGENIFHGGFGLINFQGIVKPSFHAFRMLNQLGDKLLYYKDPLIVTKNSATGKTSAIAFNYPKEYEQAVPSAKNANTFMQASAKDVAFTLKGYTPGTKFVVETLDNEHGNAMQAYQKMGAPKYPSIQQTEELKKQAWETQKETVVANEKGELLFKKQLQPWTVVLIKQL